MDAQIEMLRRIDERAEQFEAALRSNVDFSIAAMVEPLSGQERTDCFEALFAIEIDYRIRQGKSIKAALWQEYLPEFRESVFRLLSEAERSKPKLLGPYELREKMWQGSTGDVYKAWHSGLRQYLGIKILPKPDTERGNPNAKGSLEWETKATGKLKHPNVVAAISADVRDGVHFVVMEYCDGTDLRRVLRRVGRCNVDDACLIICQVAEGLQHIHENGFAHHGIKPGNLMLSEAGIMRILDRELASSQPKAAQAKAAQANTATLPDVMSPDMKSASYDYMSPEQIMAFDKIDIRSDIFSLGVIFYQLLSGTLPSSKSSVSGSRLQQLVARTQQPVKSIGDKQHGLPSAVVAVCDRMLRIDRNARFSEPAEIRYSLQQHCTGADLVELLYRAKSSKKASP